MGGGRAAAHGLARVRAAGMHFAVPVRWRGGVPLLRSRRPRCRAARAPGPCKVRAAHLVVDFALQQGLLLLKLLLALCQVLRVRCAHAPQGWAVGGRREHAHAAARGAACVRACQCTASQRATLRPRVAVDGVISGMGSARRSQPSILVSRPPTLAGVHFRHGVPFFTCMAVRVAPPAGPEGAGAACCPPFCPNTRPSILLPCTLAATWPLRQRPQLSGELGNATYTTWSK